MPHGSVRQRWALIISGCALTLLACQLLPLRWLSLAPPLLAVGLAFATRRPLLSLFCGAFLGALVAHQGQPLQSLARLLAQFGLVISDPGHLKILGFTLLLGVVARGASRHLRTLLSDLATGRWFRSKDPRKAQAGTWLFGMLLFIDDYLNAMLVGATSRSLFDRARVSRAKLAFLVDATAAPVSSLAPVSTWIAVELGYIAQHSAYAKNQGAMVVFLESLPHRFYPILLLLLALASIVFQREFAAMRRAPVHTSAPEPLARERRARYSALLGLLPLGAVFTAVFVVMLYGAWTASSSRHLSLAQAVSESDSLVALLAGASLGALLALALEWRFESSMRARQLAVDGISSMLPASAILLGAWTLAQSLQELGTAQSVAGLLATTHSAHWLPAAVFAIAALTSFATGTSWGTMAILFPLALPLATQLAPGSQSLEVSVVGAVLAGSVFGDHCSPLSDTTVISAAAAGCSTMEHVVTQLPYALTVGITALGLHLLHGATHVPAGWLLLLGALLVVGWLLLFGKPARPNTE